MKALITGANGFVGSHLTTYLATRGYEVTALILKGTDTSLLSQLHPGLENVTIVEGNVLDRKSLKSLVEPVDYVFHLAAVIRGYTQQDYDRINLEGTRNIIQACCKYNPKIKRLTIVSSIAATKPGTPECPACEDESDFPPIRDFYGVSKYKLERVALSCNDRIPISIIRPCPVIGPGDLVGLDLFKVVKKGFKIAYPGAKRPLNFIDVGDLVQSIHLCSIHKNAVGETFHIAGNGVITWEDLQELIGYYIFGRKYGSLLGVVFPDFLLVIVAIVMESLYKLFKMPAPFFNRSKAQNAVAKSNVCSAEKAKQLLGWKPKFNYIQMVKRAGNWAKNQGLI